MIVALTSLTVDPLSAGTQRQWCTIGLTTRNPSKGFGMGTHRPSVGATAGKLLSVAAFVAAIALVALMPVMVGMSWNAILDVLAGVSLSTLLALSALWILGLLTHTLVLTAALPGLSKRRALLLNLSGSAVSNLVPFGGAAGMGLGYVMARTWHVSPTSFASYTAISNLWNILGKLFVGAALLSGAVVLGMSLPPALHGALAFGSVAVLVGLFAVIGIACNARSAGAFGRALDRCSNSLLARFGSSRRIHAEGWIHQTRLQSSETVSAGWGRLTLGVLAYLFLQALLLGACLVAVGAHLPWLVIAVAFGIERLLTLVPFTPGGSGLAEIGTVAVLVALGGDPVTVAAGVVLYRLFTFLLEIPVGGVSALVWLRRNRLQVKQPVAV